MNKPEIIKHTVKQLFEHGNTEIISSAFSSEYTAHAENKEYKGHDFIMKFTKLLCSSFSGIRVLKTDILVENEDRITWQRTVRGTHITNMMGIPPSNKTITWNEMIVSRFEGDKIVEEWVVSELLGQLLLK